MSFLFLCVILAGLHWCSLYPYSPRSIDCKTPGADQDGNIVEGGTAGVNKRGLRNKEIRRRKMNAGCAGKKLGVSRQTTGGAGNKLVTSQQMEPDLTWL